MLRRTRRRALIACAVMGVTALATAPGALAATLTTEPDGTLKYASTTAGINNNVAFQHDGADAIRVFEHNQNEPIVATAEGCVQNTQYDVTCSGDYTAIQVDLGSGNDNADVQIPLPTVINGGEGDDYLNFWPYDQDYNGVPTAGTLNGEAGNDYLDSGDGSQTLNGGDGDDWHLSANNGDDTINGGPGNDSNLYGGDGNDTINGGEGDDSWLDGGAGNDTVNGGGGRDYIVDFDGDRRYNDDGTGNDTLNGDADNDVICDGDGDDKISGGDGSDRIGRAADECYDNNFRGADAGAENHNTNPSRGNNEIDGGEGDDVLSGGTNDDVIRGGAGDDEIYGSPGNDTLDGGAGDDDFREYWDTFIVDGTEGTEYVDHQGDEGSDTYTGGPGRDYIEYDDRDVNEDGHDDDISITQDGVANDGSADEKDNVGADIENIETGDGSDTIVGGGVSNLVWSGSGNDTVNGGGGDDDIWGGADKDNLSGGDGNDDIHGDNGSFVDWAGGLNHSGESGPDVIDGGAGNDNLFGDYGNDTLKGGDGNDGLYGGPGADDMSGGSGADFVDYAAYGDRVNVTLDDQANDGNIGEDDNVRTDVEDVITGQGNDNITGSAAANTLSSGAGNDTVNSRDTVSDLVICGPGVDTALVDNLDVVEREGVDRCERVEVAQIPGPVTPPVARVAPKALTSKVTPGKDTKFPYTFRTRGALTLPAGVSAADACNGLVSVTFKRGKSTISRRLVSLSTKCTYSSRVTFAVKRRLVGAKKLKVIVRFQGNARLLPKSASRKSVRIK
jgi:Ca2+-binding RTX toxin-like protein